MSRFGGACWSPSVSQPRWLRFLLRRKVTINDLPEEILLEVLSLIPRRDLILNCRLVCSRWRDLVDLPILWKLKCQKMGFYPKSSTIQDWRTFCFQHSMRNLVKNPCGEEGLDFWELDGTEWAVSEEIMPLFQEEFYMISQWIPHPPQDVQKCFIFVCPEDSNIQCGRKRQRITLGEEGYTDRLMDEIRPNILVKDWQYDVWKSFCGLRVKLLSADFDVLQECSVGATHLCNWTEISRTFDNYPPGVRHIDLEHEADIRSYVKMTGTSVTIDPEEAGRGELLAPLPRENAVFGALSSGIRNRWRSAL